MHFFKSLLVVGVLFSTTLAAPLTPVEAGDLQAREYDLDPDYTTRWLSEEVVTPRDLSEDFEHLIARGEDFADFLVIRNKWLEAAKKIRTGLKTKSGEAVFWSGNTPRPGKKPMSAGEAAKVFAKANGGSTLQMKLKQEGITMPKYNPKDPKDRAGQLWRIASKRFASKANGPINAFLGQNVNKNGIYLKAEKPILLKNPAVTKLIENTQGKPPQVVKGAPKK